MYMITALQLTFTHYMNTELHASVIHVKCANKFTIFLQLQDRVFPFQNSLKNLDLSNKTDLDLWDYLGKVKLVFFLPKQSQNSKSVL